MKAIQVSSINRQLPMIASYILVSLMMVCLAFTVVTVGNRVFPAWQGGYFLAIAFFVSIETLLSWKYLEDTAMFTPEWALQQAAEWIVIYLFIRISIYWSNGFSTLAQDLDNIARTPLEILFSVEMVTALFFALFIRMLSGSFAERLRLIEHDADRLDLERKGFFVEDREKVRISLISFVFLPGAGMLLLTTLSRVQLSGGGVQIVNVQTAVWNLLLYFIAGLSLLALARFSTLRTRWYLHEIPVYKNLALRWGLYSLTILLGVALIASVLPTRYSIGFLALLGWLITGISFILAILQFIILAPIIFLIQQLLNLLGKPIDSPPAPIVPPVPPLPAPQSTAALPWLEVLKSVLFWAVLLFVILFSIYQYLKQREEMLTILRKTRVLKIILQIKGWFLGLFQKMNASLDQNLIKGIRRLLKPLTRDRAIFHPFSRPPSRSDPRNQILITYLNFVDQNQSSPFERKRPETPQEYQNHLKDSLPEASEAIDQLTDSFVEARYTLKPIPEKTADQAKISWKRIVDAIRKYVQNKP